MTREDAIATLKDNICSSCPYPCSTGMDSCDIRECDNRDAIKALEEQKTGHWMRMSDLSEQEDDRYKCSRCGNVVHYSDKMNLYTFNSWCGRCGSDNGRHINYTDLLNNREEEE